MLYLLLFHLWLFSITYFPFHQLPFCSWTIKIIINIFSWNELWLVTKPSRIRKPPFSFHRSQSTLSHDNKHFCKVISKSIVEVMDQTRKIDPTFDLWLSVTMTLELRTLALRTTHSLIMVNISAKLFTKRTMMVLYRSPEQTTLHTYYWSFSKVHCSKIFI